MVNVIVINSDVNWEVALTTFKTKIIVGLQKYKFATPDMICKSILTNSLR